MDIDTLRLPGSRTAKLAASKPLIQPYLRGPIPWTWLHAAMKLPGATLKVALVLWHHWRLNKRQTYKKGTNDIAKFVGVSTATVRRAIDALQVAGLIARDCAEGRKCLITMIEHPIILGGGSTTSPAPARTDRLEGELPEVGFVVEVPTSST